METAKKLDLEEILSRVVPRVYRVALSLCQNHESGLLVVTKVLSQSGVIFDRWENDEDADRWFLRYTVLCSRRQASMHEDLLFSQTGDPAWKAIIRALRQLPMQQGEAYLLHHGEGLALRQMAVAMDCSSSAAAKHLSAAETALCRIAGDRLPGFATALPGLMAALVPAPQLMEVEVRQVIRKRRRMKWIRRWVILPLKGGMTLLIGWTAWKIWRRVA